MFTFSYEDPWDDSTPQGIYDANAGKILFDPRFFDITFMDDGWICVEVFDEQLDRNVERIIDRNGKEKFHSIYSSIYTWKDPYVVVISDESGRRTGLIDKDGNVILPCKYDAAWNGIYPDKRLIVFNKDGYKGIVSFDDEILVPAKFLEIRGTDQPFFIVRLGDKEDENHYTEGMIDLAGNYVIAPNARNIRWCKDNRVICEYEDHCEVLQLFLTINGS